MSDDENMEHEDLSDCMTLNRYALEFKEGNVAKVWMTIDADPVSADFSLAPQGKIQLASGGSGLVPVIWATEDPEENIKAYWHFKLVPEGKPIKDLNRFIHLKTLTRVQQVPGGVEVFTLHVFHSEFPICNGCGGDISAADGTCYNGDCEFYDKTQVEEGTSG